MSRAPDLTLKERLFIKECLDKDITGNKIGEYLNRSHTCIYGELKINGGIKAYDPNQAHENYLIRRREKYAKITQKNSITWERKRKDFIPTPDKINNLQMQIDIILEELQTIRKKMNV